MWSRQRITGADGDGDRATERSVWEGAGEFDTALSYAAESDGRFVLVSVRVIMDSAF